jgi:hypothetical protein
MYLGAQPPRFHILPCKSVSKLRIVPATDVAPNPAIVKQVLRYTLKEVRADGSVPYEMVGHGAVACMTSDNSSDMPLWLLWAMSEYILATRDKAFLDDARTYQQVPDAWVPWAVASAGYRQILARFRWVTGSRDQVTAADKLVGERNVIFRARGPLAFGSWSRFHNRRIDLQPRITF